jgi:transketolase
MRNAFAQQLTVLAEADDRIVLLSGDIGNRLFDDFKARCPGRFYNCGVAEANLIGMAAGLALSGLRPVCYTITPFLTYRCLEQIRIDICYHRLPVVIVGTGAGLSYASLGATHHSCEDMGMLRLLPGLVVLAPADEHEVRVLLKGALRSPDPVYVRIGKKGEPKVHAREPELSIGRALRLREGRQAAILSAGTLLPVALAAADRLDQRGLSIAVFSFPTLKPLDEETLLQVGQSLPLVVTLEEHSVLGGLGGAVAEWLMDHPNARARLLRLGTRDEFLHLTCDQAEARAHYGLTPDAVAERIQEAMPAPL